MECRASSRSSRETVEVRVSVTNLNSDSFESQIEQSAPAIHTAFGWGLAFSAGYFRQILTCAVLPIFFQILGESYLFFFAAGDRERFLVHVLLRFADAWLLGAIGMIAIDSARGQEIQLSNVWIRALTHLPKVFLSSFFVFQILMAAFHPVTLVIVIFLIWAPLFCLGEYYARQQLPEPVDDEEEDIPAEFLVLGQFQFKGMLELGFARSLQFAGYHLRLSMQVLVLLMASNLLPYALIVLCFGDDFPLASIVSRALVVYPCEVFAVGVWAASFFGALSSGAQMEIGVKPSLDRRTSRLLRRNPWLEFGNKGLPFVLLALVSIGAFSVVHDFFQRQSGVPSHVQISVQKALFGEEQFLLELEIEDEQRRFRWLDREKLCIVLPDGEKWNIVKPEKVLASSAQGVKLARGQEYLSDGPLKLQLSFPNSGFLKDGGKFGLGYTRRDASLQILLEESYPKGW